MTESTGQLLTGLWLSLQYQEFPEKQFSQQSHKAPLPVSNINMFEQKNGLKFQVIFKQLNHIFGSD